MNEYELERKRKTDAQQELLLNLKPETIEKVLHDIQELPDSGWKRYELKVIAESYRLKIS